MIRIGILCPSNIAFRRFLPALKKSNDFAYVGVAYAASDEWFGGYAADEVVNGERLKAEGFQEAFGGEVIKGYSSLLSRSDIDAVYLPLPPAVHYDWAKKALEQGKHVFVEKPSTTRAEDTNDLIQTARKFRLAVHENYMFVYHRQISEIRQVVASGEIGEERLVRASFGFPFRGYNDFRYKKSLGGGALLDCGGYPIRLARLLLGDTAALVEGHLSYSEIFGVDLYGNATLRNKAGLTAQVAFGMDNGYQCKLEIWGSKGVLKADRVFTPPADLSPKLIVQTNEETRTIDVAPDDQFLNSINVFSECMQNPDSREARYSDILNQAKMIDALRNIMENS